MVNIWDNKDAMLARYISLVDDIYEGYENVLYMDGSKTDCGCAAAYVIYERGLIEGAKGIAVPGDWSIMECELFAIYKSLQIFGEYYCGAVWLFSDCVTALRCIDNM